MGLLDWLKTTLFPNDDIDDEEYDEEQNYEEEPDEEEEEEAPARPSILSSFRVLGRRNREREDEEEEDEIFEEEAPVRPAARPQAPQRPAATPRIYRFHAASLEDARRICEALRGRNMVLVDLEGTPFSMAQSVMDFCCGACCALSCGIRNVNKNVFIMGPNDADFDAAFGDGFTTFRGKFKSYD